MGRGMGLGKSVMEFSFLTLLGLGWDTTRTIRWVLDRYCKVESLITILKKVCS